MFNTLHTRPEMLAHMEDKDPGNIKTKTTWPIFTWIYDQVGNLMGLGIVVMVVLLVWGVIIWVGGSNGDNHRKVVGGKVMVFGAIIGAIVIAAAPSIIKWATGQNPIS